MIDFGNIRSAVHSKDAAAFTTALQGYEGSGQEVLTYAVNHLGVEAAADLIEPAARWHDTTPNHQTRRHAADWFRLWRDERYLVVYLPTASSHWPEPVEHDAPFYTWQDVGPSLQRAVQSMRRAHLAEDAPNATPDITRAVELFIDAVDAWIEGDLSMADLELARRNALKAMRRLGPSAALAPCTLSPWYASGGFSREQEAAQPAINRALLIEALTPYHTRGTPHA